MPWASFGSVNYSLPNYHLLGPWQKSGALFRPDLCLSKRNTWWVLCCLEPITTFSYSSDNTVVLKTDKGQHTNVWWPLFSEEPADVYYCLCGRTCSMKM